MSNSPTLACIGKQGFDTWSAADKVLRAMRRHRTHHGRAAIYRCPYCPKWHIGQRI